MVLYIHNRYPKIGIEVKCKSKVYEEKLMEYKEVCSYILDIIKKQ